MKDNFGLMKDSGFSAERMELFKRIIDHISAVSIKEDRHVPAVEIALIISKGNLIISKGNLIGTIEKAVKWYALPNGICIVKDTEMNSYYQIKSGIEYTEWLGQINEQISDLNEQKGLAASAWMNDRRYLNLNLKEGNDLSDSIASRMLSDDTKAPKKID